MNVPTTIKNAAQKILMLSLSLFGAILGTTRCLERKSGNDPDYTDWQPVALPLCYIRVISWDFCKGIPKPLVVGFYSDLTSRLQD